MNILHFIGTARMKTKYELVKNEHDKLQPKKMGFGIEQREMLEYEFTTVFEGDIDHNFTVTKDRTSLFQSQILLEPDEKTGKAIIKWLIDGQDISVDEQVNLIMEKLPEKMKLSGDSKSEFMAETIDKWEGFIKDIKLFHVELAKFKIKKIQKNIKKENLTKEELAEIKLLKSSEDWLSFYRKHNARLKKETEK